jgi:hypothetical protein
VTGVLDRNEASLESLMHYCTQRPAAVIENAGTQQRM